MGDEPCWMPEGSLSAITDKLQASLSPSIVRIDLLSMFFLLLVLYCLTQLIITAHRSHLPTCFSCSLIQCSYHLLVLLASACSPAHSATLSSAVGKFVTSVNMERSHKSHHHSERPRRAAFWQAQVAAAMERVVIDLTGPDDESQQGDVVYEAEEAERADEVGEDEGEVRDLTESFDDDGYGGGTDATIDEPARWDDGDTAIDEPGRWCEADTAIDESGRWGVGDTALDETAAEVDSLTLEVDEQDARCNFQLAEAKVGPSGDTSGHQLTLLGFRSMPHEFSAG